MPSLRVRSPAGSGIFCGVGDGFNDYRHLIFSPPNLLFLFDQGSCSEALSYDISMEGALDRTARGWLVGRRSTRPDSKHQEGSTIGKGQF